MNRVPAVRQVKREFHLLLLFRFCLHPERKDDQQKNKPVYSHTVCLKLCNLPAEKVTEPMPFQAAHHWEPHHAICGCAS